MASALFFVLVAVITGIVCLLFPRQLDGQSAPVAMVVAVVVLLIGAAFGWWL